MLSTFRRPLCLLPPSLPAALLLTALPATADIVVVDGDDLAAIVAAAPSGETIRIQSNGTFVGALAFGGKDLTIQADPGFEPALRSGSDAPVVLLDMDGTGAVFRGLRILPEPGGSPWLLRADTDPGVSNEGAVELIDCTVEGGVTFNGASGAAFGATLRGTRVTETVNGFASQGVALQVSVLDGSHAGDLDLWGSGGALVFSVEDSRIDSRVRVASSASGSIDGQFRRTRIFGGLSPVDLGGGATRVDVESCLIVGTGDPQPGIFPSKDAQVTAVNVTVSGFSLGITALGFDPPQTYANMALYGNDVSVSELVAADRIASSLISDGTHAGLNGNFAGVPTVVDGGALLTGSIGIDAGDSFHPLLGALDLNGDPRIQDGDGDGRAIVNVGAIETVAPCAGSASFSYFNGSGVNPEALTLAAPPVLGDDLVVDVDTAPATLVTGIVVGLAAPTPFLLPGLLGEVLMDPALTPLGDLAQGSHVFAIPSDPTFCGRELDLQGFRVDGVAIVMLNGSHLTLGS